MGDEQARRSITVEVVCARPNRQAIIQVQLPAAATAREAVKQAQLDTRFPEMDFATAPLGSYGRLVDDALALKDGDRIEVLRPLEQDPRDARREAAARGETMLSRPEQDGG